MQKNNKKHFLLAIAMLVAMAISYGQVHGQTTAQPIGLLRAKNPVPNHYIVVLKDPEPGIHALTVDTTSAAKELASQYSGDLGFTYQSALRGFSATMTEDRALALSNDPRVAYVEEDSKISLESTQVSPPWGLDRIDRRLGLNASYDFVNTGAGVNVYVIDSGILWYHGDFGLRAALLADFVYDGRSGSGDCFGHGTHVAGIIGGGMFGVAKGVSLYGLRVFDCQGQGNTSTTIAAVDWLTSHKTLPAVANMSLGSDPDEGLDAAVRNSIASGITYVVAAGNQGIDASNRSPARVAEAITVAATDSSDSEPTWSNFGPLVDLFAPGDNITSDWYTSPTATATLSGTSMASPHVAGVAALYLQTHPTATPAMVSNMITTQATRNVIQNLHSGTVNALLYVTYATATVTIAGQEQHACSIDTGNRCTGTIFDAGTVTVTVNGRTYSVPYGKGSLPRTIAAALAASINTDPDVSASVSGTTISLTSKFGCFTLGADANTSLPLYFNPSFTATASNPVCP